MSDTPKRPESEQPNPNGPQAPSASEPGWAGIPVIPEQSSPETPDGFNPEDGPEQPGGKSKRKGQTLLAWAVITLMICVMFALTTISSGEQEVDEEQALIKATTRFQAQYIIGAQSFVAGQGQEKTDDLYKGAEAMNTGPVWQRLSFVTMAGELKGPTEAIKLLDQLQTDLDERADRDDLVSPEQEQTISILRGLYVKLDEGIPANLDIDQQQRTLLSQELGWFADLALNPEGLEDSAGRKAVLGPTQKIMLSVIVLGVFALGFGLLGLVGLVFLVIMAFKNKLAGSIFSGLSYGGLYAETFALWMVVFLILQIVGGVVISALKMDQYHLLAAGLGMLASMAALVWPVLRGVPFGQMLKDVGLHGGRKPWAEPFLGIASYAMTLPILAVGFLMTALLTALQQKMAGDLDPFTLPETPSHPIMDAFSEPGIGLFVQIFFVASVCAPIVEETMFRGVLYRHLREAFGSRLGVALSIIFSALLSSFVFAAIHPQGWVAIPALMSLAVGMCIAREWRDSLVPSIVLHGIHNGLLMSLMIMFFS